MGASLLRLTTSAALVGALSLTMASCGRKGDLDRPSTPVAQQNKADAPEKSKAPDRKFFLDPLL
ncbi:LPS translocon maturation chaperone LptM [Allorhizobium undicola]|uniref:LPS translocon maturation chaperone LptM n=1 Tax=Allorhizobium undicola TaxID=78527 RepID=UPI00055DA951|nr:lipoprotein [Allorhizobium undicola]